MGRSLFRIAELAPGLTANTPNNWQIAINGSFAYDNIYLVDGVDVNDNLFGNANSLFIEDAVEESQVLTSGISAGFTRGPRFGEPTSVDHFPQYIANLDGLQTFRMSFGLTF